MRKEYLILFVILLLKVILQYLSIDPVYELHRDEFLHIDLGNHLAWGYTTVPPVTGFISYLIILLGKSVFWVKFFPALFGGLTLVVVWQIVRELKGGWFALLMSGTAIICSAYMRINTLYQPNSLDFLMWTLLFLTIIKYIKTKEIFWLMASAVVFGFGFLNKYNMAFLIIGLLPAMLLTGYGYLFTRKFFYTAILLSLIIISPNIMWQYNNDFPVFDHLNALVNFQLVNVSRADFIFTQILFFIPSLFVLIIAFVGAFRYKLFREYRLIFYTYLFVILIFIFLKAKSYYSLGLYPVLIALGSVYLEFLIRKTSILVKLGIVLIPAVIFFFMFPLILPSQSPGEIQDDLDKMNAMGLTRWEDGRLHEIPQDYADMLGWRELASLVDSAFTMVDEKDHLLIQCDNYGQTGAINFYAKKTTVEALSLHGDYIFWYPLDEKEYHHVILVKEAGEEHGLEEMFEEIIKIGAIQNQYAREKGTTVYLMKNAVGSINEVLRGEIRERLN